MRCYFADEARAGGKSAFSFNEVEAGVDQTHHVAEGYDADVLLRWGDPLFSDAADFDPKNQTAAAQAKQFGYNNDYVGFIPLDGSAEHGLLVVNHEYTDPHLMFPGIVKVVEKDGKKTLEVAALTKDQVDVEIAAHGGTVVEIRKDGGKWQVVKNGKLNRRITAATEMVLSGPAAGHDRLKTNADPTGAKVIGTVNNCAGGVTPWGTYVMAKENIHGYFSGELPADHKEAANYKRMGIPEGAYEWAAHYDRFDLSKEPNEANRFGSIVEVDVNDPTSMPKKRTALGRFKHEGSNLSLLKTAVSSSTSATTNALTMSTNSSPAAPSIPTIARPIWTCLTTASSTSPSSLRMAPWSGCRSCMAKDRSLRQTNSTAKPTC